MPLLQGLVKSILNMQANADSTTSAPLQLSAQPFLTRMALQKSKRCKITKEKNFVYILYTTQMGITRPRIAFTKDARLRIHPNTLYSYSVPLHGFFASSQLHIRVLAGRALLAVTRLYAKPTARHLPRTCIGRCERKNLRSHLVCVCVRERENQKKSK